MDQSTQGTHQDCIVRADSWMRKKARPFLSQFVICALVLLQVIFVSALAIADQLTLKDGRRFQGRLVSKSSSQVVFEIQRGTAIITQKFPTAEVLNVSVGQGPSPATSPGQSTTKPAVWSLPMQKSSEWSPPELTSTTKSAALSAPIFRPNVLSTPDEDYKNGQAAGEAKDYVTAAAFLRRAADKGHAGAQVYLGSLYSDGSGVPQSDEEAARYYRKAADQGLAIAQWDLGNAYRDGKGVPQSDEEAVRWYQRAANQGSAFFQEGLGTEYSRGTGALHNDEEAAKWFRKAADQGDAIAETELAQAYSEGKGVPKNDEEAAKWFRKGADQGDYFAQLRLGDAYRYGEGAPQSDEEAVKWYSKAADQGDAIAQYNLGVAYENGKGVPQSNKEAAKWYRDAADQGNAVAQFALGMCYDFGQGVSKSDAEAAKWYRKAADQGNAAAQFALGACYDFGQGVSKSNAEAAKWYHKAADQGYINAQFNLGLDYEEGVGVPKSESVAIDLFYKAATGSINEANRELALRAYDLMRSIDPQHPLVEQLKQQLYSPQEAKGGADAKPDQATISMGTGWPVAEGYVITNHHVIAGASKFTVIRSDGVKMSASVAAKDVANDLVLLRVDDPTKLPPGLPVASKQPAIGEHVFTIGYPQTDVMGTNEKLTDGTVSALTGLDDDPRALQINVAIQPGNSGGPLFNSKGEVVGVVASKLNAVEFFKLTGKLPEGVSYAIKVSYVKALLDSAPQKPTSKVLGAQEAPLPDLAKRVEGSILRVICE